MRARDVATPRAVIRPVRRDTIFRRLLAVADMLAAVGGLLVLGMFTRKGVPPVTFAAVPLIVVMAKVAGRYDHDELVLRKSTLEEVPSLVILAGGFALAWSAVTFLIGAKLDPSRAAVVVLWASTSAWLIIGRTSARAMAAALAPPERVLVVGDADSRAKVTQALSYDPAARVEIIGYLPLEEGDDELPFDELQVAVGTLGVDRVFLIPTHEHTEAALDLVRRTAARRSQGLDRAAPFRGGGVGGRVRRRLAGSPCSACAARLDPLVADDQARARHRGFGHRPASHGAAGSANCAGDQARLAGPGLLPPGAASDATAEASG